MKRFALISAFLLALLGAATVASADHTSRGWADHFFEDLQRNGGG